MLSLIVLFCRFAVLLGVCVLTASASSFIEQDWSVDLGGPIFGSPLVRDLDADGDYEVLVCSSSNGKLHLLDHHGNPLEGWPVDIIVDEPGEIDDPGVIYTTILGIKVSPSVGDIDGDGELEIIVADANGLSYVTSWGAPRSKGATFGYLHVWDLDGAPKDFTRQLDGTLKTPEEIAADGNRLKLDGSIKAQVRLIDVDDDGSDELLVHTGASLLYLLNGDGSVRTGWPKALGGATDDFSNWIVGSSPVALDLDYDGDIEIAIATSGGEVHLYDAAGNTVSGWPVSTDNVEAGDGLHLSSLVAVDLDGDYQLELVLGGADGKVYAWHADGTRVDGFPTNYTDGSIVASVAAADIRSDSDGPELVVVNTAGLVFCFSSGGDLLSGWPWGISGAGYSSPIIVDSDNSGGLDVVVPGSLSLLFFDAAGSHNPDMVFAANALMRCAPSCADLDNDGDLELLYASTANGYNGGPNGTLYCVGLSTSGQFASNSTQFGWPGFLGERGELSSGPTGDRDSDLISDDYERYYFGSTEYAAGDDFDEDGFSNYAEWAAGTNPTDASDLFRIDSITFGIGFEEEVVVELKWKSKIGHRYDIYSKHQLDASWTLVEQNVDFGGNTTTIWPLQFDQAEAQCFYSIGVSRAFVTE